MNKKLYITLGIFLVVFVAIVTFLLLKNNASVNNTKQTKTPEQTKTQQQVMEIIKNTQKISLTEKGFEPKTVTIDAGTRVLWTNLSGGQGTINSDPYPTNGLWKFLNLGLFNNGENMSVTFEKSGKYTYHNQLKPEQTGTIIVQ